MKGEAKKLFQFFEGSDKRFCIPLYQRNYDWKEENCEQLFSDLVRVHKEHSKSHFFGSIVSSLADEDEEVRLIIDGQQRITTVSLILIAMIKAAEKGDLTYDKKERIDYIRDVFLIDKYKESERKVKLKPIKKDMEAFDALLFKETNDFVKDSVVTRNYNYFYDKIKGCGLKLEELLEAIKKLEIINIRLDKEDDAQLIFESLNSTGLDLSESDKIRNYLLMSLSAKEQETAYEAYWNKIEIATDYAPTMFIRDYLTIKSKTHRITKIENLYFGFKKYSEETGLSRMEIMADMLKYAVMYHKIIEAEVENPTINNHLNHLSLIDSQLHLPFVLPFFLYAEETGMSTSDKHEVIKTLESYWARRIICNLPSNALNKVFATLHSDVLKQIDEFAKHGEPFVSSYPEVLKCVLLRKQGTSELPNDREVAEEMKTRNVYKMPHSHKYFLFERMNNGLSKEHVEVVKQMKEGMISIEHIMPQTLSQKWKSDLGPNYQDIYDKYIHTFANLTLSAYNQNYSNAPYADKWNGMTDREGKNIVGYKDSIYNIGADLRNYSQWTEAEIIDRQGKLIERFRKIWPMPTSSFIPLQNSADNVTFDEDIDLTGRYISAFSYKGTRQVVSSWKDMLLDLCYMLYREHKTSMEFLCSKGAYFFAEPHQNCTQFAPGCFVYSDCSTKSKIAIIKKVFSECNIPEDELLFELTPVGQADPTLKFDM